MVFGVLGFMMGGGWWVWVVVVDELNPSVRVCKTLNPVVQNLQKRFFLKNLGILKEISLQEQLCVVFFLFSENLLKWPICDV